MLIQISFLIVFAAVFGLIAKNLKQSPIVGYIVAGIFLGLTGIIADYHLLEEFSRIGVMMLLFLLGLEININRFVYLGKDIIIASFLQIVITFFAGLFLTLLLGFSLTSSLLISIALTFSSTIVVVKILSENRDLQSLFGRISVGILIIQDVVAILALGMVSAFYGSQSQMELLIIPLKILLLIVTVYIFSKKILPWIYLRLINDSLEMVFVFSIAWVFLFSVVTERFLGLSLEMGGLLAGVSLSFLPQQLEIVSKTKPLKDFFLIIFFVYNGLVFAEESVFDVSFILPFVLLFVFVVVVKATIIMAVLGITGYRKRTSFMAGITLSQISEFSIILLTLGGKLAGVEIRTIALISLVTLASMSLTSYLYSNSTLIFTRLSQYLSVFEKKITKEGVFVRDDRKKDHVVLVGCHRTGGIILNYLKKKAENLVVVDFDPEVHSRLAVNQTDVVLGDISDIEVLEAANISQAKMVISTIPGFEENLEICEYLKNTTQKPTLVVSAKSRREAVVLYEKGADFVFVNDIIAGDHIKNILKLNKLRPFKIKKSGKLHFNRLISLRY